MTRRFARPHAFGLVAALLWTSVAPGVAWAQSVPTRPGMEALQAMFDRGVEAEQTSRHAEACALFEEVLRYIDEPRVRLNLAISYRAIGRNIDAIEQLRHYLAAPLPEDSADNLAQMRQAIETMRAQLAPLTLRVRPESFHLRVDRRAVSLDDRQLALDPGPHTLEFSAEGYQPLRRELRAEAGRAIALDLALDPIVTTGRVVVTPSPASASVTVDGRVRGLGVTELLLDAGEHVVDVSAPSHTPLHRVVRLSPGSVVHVDAALPLAQSRPRWILPTIVGGSVLVVFAAVISIVLLTRPEAPATPGPLPSEWNPTWGVFRAP